MATTLDTTHVPDDLRSAQRGVVRRLERVRRRLRLHLLIEGLFWTLTAVLLAAAASYALDRVFRLSLPVRQGLLVVALVAIGVVVYRRLVRPLSLPLADLDLAALLDRRAPGVGEQIANVLQLPELLASEFFASPVLVEAAVAECAQSLDRVDLTATLNTPRRGKLLAGSAAWLLAALACWALWPATAELWARRWLAGSDVRWPQQTYLSIVGLQDATTLLVPRGEVSLIEIDARPSFITGEAGWQLPGRGAPLIVESQEPPASQTPEQVAVNYKLSDGTRKRGSAVQYGDTMFRYELAPLADTAQLRITGGDDWLGPIILEPVDRPAIASLEILAKRAGSQDVETQRVGAGSEFLYLRETQLELRLVADQPLESAEVLDKGVQLKGWERVGERGYVLRWTMQEPLALEFRLVGRRGQLTSKPYFLAIGLLKDREPRVTIRSSGVGRRITPVARVPLALRGTDDFGVTALGLELERTQLAEDKPTVTTDKVDLSGELPPAEAASARIDVELDHELALKDRGLAPGNLIKLRGAASDNCALGTQAGISRWLAFQIVSADELFYELLTRQREQRAKFAKSLESAKQQSAALAGLAKREDAIAISRAESVIDRQVAQVATQLDASWQEMTLNDLGNPQARDLLQNNIIAPLRTLHSEQLARLRAAVDELAAQETISEERRAEAVKNSDEAVRAMEAILAQMAQWESFVDVINQLKHVIDAQGKVLQSTDDLRKKRTDALFDE